MKPEPKDKTSARARRLHFKSRNACRDEVFRRDDSKCRSCGAPVLKLDKALFWWQAGHVHEHPPRSQGGDPLDPDGCVLLCHECHMPGGSHGNRPAIEWLDPERRARGPVQFTWKGGRVTVSEPPPYPDIEAP